MLLTNEQSAKIWRTHGAWVREACDKCGKVILDSVTWTIRGEPGVYCSQVCRDGFAEAYGKCRQCGASLAGKKRGTEFCDAKCRKRFVRDGRNVEDHRKIADSDLTKSAAYGAQKGRVSILGQTAPIRPKSEF